MNVGDRVKLNTLNPRHGMGQARYGDIGIVSHFDRVRNHVKVDFDHHRGWNGQPSELLLLEFTDNEKASYLLEDSDPFFEPVVYPNAFDSADLPF